MDKRIYLLTTLTFIVGLVELIIGGILPFIAADLDITLGQAGLLISAFSLSFAIAGPVLLSLTAKVERKKINYDCSRAIFVFKWYCGHQQ